MLVVEDDGVYAEFMVDTLRRAGHQVSLATDGASARLAAVDLVPDAVVLDLRLPDESGYDVARALRRGLLPEHSVIIVLTAERYPPLDAASAVGVDIVLNKPVEAELVIGMIDHIRAQRAARIRGASRAD